MPPWRSIRRFGPQWTGATTGLVNKSVLTCVGQQGSCARYSMLDALRQYGRECLTTDTELAIRRRHRDSHQCCTARVRHLHGEHAFKAYVQRGRLMTTEAALAYALGKESTTPS